jgi:hypothetical protein
MYLFDYYVFIDYSENLIGYAIIEKSKINDVLPKISRLKHYKEVKHKKEYLTAINKIIENQKIKTYFIKIKIKEMRQNIDLYADIADFLKYHKNCMILMSVDNNQYISFCRILKIISDKKTKIVKESELKKNSIEYKLSLVIDNLLNIERKSK